MLRTMKRERHFLPLLLLLFVPFALSPSAVFGQNLPCQPCGGVRLGDPTEAAAVLDTLTSAARFKPGSPLFVAWDVVLDGAPNPSAEPATAIHAAGATPWLGLVFRTPSPLAANIQRLQTELSAAARIAADAPSGTYFQVTWRPDADVDGGEGGAPTVFDPAEYAFLLKQAAVAITGAKADARVATTPLPADADVLRQLYAQEIAAYLEMITLAPADLDTIAAVLPTLAELDPGRPIALDAGTAASSNDAGTAASSDDAGTAANPNEAGTVLATAARGAAAGIALTLFSAPDAKSAPLAPLVLLAREFSGDISYDPTSSPAVASGGEAWAFVRGEDLSLRVIAEANPASPASNKPAGGREMKLSFPDGTLRKPIRYSYYARRVSAPSGQLAGGGLTLTLADTAPIEVLALERPSVEEREGISEQLTVASEREIPVEEILRRLQAFEDAQNRRIDHYRAINSTALRFQLSGAQSFEATLAGPYFVDESGAPDWVWRDLFVNGVRWRGKTIPEIPLVQPEKAATMPLSITFGKQYRYRLRDSEKLNGRDAWVVDFAPAEEAKGAAEKLYRGTVWVDKQLAARLKTRAIQLGLEGEVISNEETLLYSPIDAQGQAAAWSNESFILPLRIVAQQILSVVNTATVVERETTLTDVVINGPGFAEERVAANASDSTIVRDTQAGLRYLVKDDTGTRVVKEGFDRDKLFLAGGVFYDDALDFPLPLAGINYFSLDFKGSKQQVNVFFGGALLITNLAQPRLFGSKWDAGVDAFAIALPLSDTIYRNEEEITGEEVEVLPSRVTFNLGRPLGNFWKASASYRLGYQNFGRTDNTDENFVAPSDHFLHTFDVDLRFARSGYRLDLSGSFNRRSEWERWGFVNNPDFDPDKDQFTRWGATVAKTWNLPKFRKFGAELGYFGGDDLDRFSKIDFGFFGSTRVHGYQSNRVRATEAEVAHLSYGIALGDVIRVDALADFAWATDKANGLDRELLSGVGLAGTFMGPWQTIVNLDVGFPVAGPDDGFVLYLVFLKLFK